MQEAITLALPNPNVVLAGTRYTPFPAKALLIHGRGSCVANLTYLQQALADRGIGTIGFDQVGNGHSTSKESVTLSLYVDALNAAIKILEEQGEVTLPLTIYGASRGANTALMLAKRLGAKCSSLILCVPAFYRDADAIVRLNPDESVVSSITLEDEQGLLESSRHIKELSPQTKLSVILAEAEEDVDNRVSRVLLSGRATEYIVKESGHNLRHFFAQNPHQLPLFINMLVDMF